MIRAAAQHGQKTDYHPTLDSYTCTQTAIAINSPQVSLRAAERTDLLFNITYGITRCKLREDP